MGLYGKNNNNVIIVNNIFDKDRTNDSYKEGLHSIEKRIIQRNDIFDKVNISHKGD